MHMTHSILNIDNTFDYQKNAYTPLNFPELASAINHINEEHYDELLEFLTAFTFITSEDLIDANVKLTDIYAEAIALQVQFKDTKNTSNQFYDQTFFIPFTSPITQFNDLNTQYILLKQKSDKKLGKKTIKLTKQTFTVQDSYKVSENMLRLELSCPRLNTSNKNSIPVDEAGYAYLFDLAHNVTASKINNDSASPAQAHRYYTLRKAWQSSDGMQAWVDVFVHENTPGGNWATALQVGNTVITKREFPEKVKHLLDGQALLIVDETSMPTAARLLELWDNPKPPLIVCVTQDVADQKYFDSIKMKGAVKGSRDGNFTILPIVTGSINSGQNLATLIDNKLSDYLTEYPLQIDKVWGALEASTVKSLRPILRERFKLNRAEVVVKVYWRRD